MCYSLYMTKEFGIDFAFNEDEKRRREQEAKIKEKEKRIEELEAKAEADRFDQMNWSI